MHAGLTLCAFLSGCFHFRGPHSCIEGERTPLQEEALQKVTDFLGCSRSFARTLLIHFRWNSDVLFGELGTLRSCGKL